MEVERPTQAGQREWELALAESGHHQECRDASAWVDGEDLARNDSLGGELFFLGWCNASPVAFQASCVMGRVRCVVDLSPATRNRGAGARGRTASGERGREGEGGGR